MDSSPIIAGRINEADRRSFDDEEKAPVSIAVKTCPLCTEEIQVLCGAGPQVVVCASCGLACSIDPVADASPAGAAETRQPTEATAEDVYSWLERPPGPILPSADFIARQQAARRRQLALAGFVAASAAMAIALLSGYFGYHQASDQLANHLRTLQNEQAATEQLLLDLQQGLERQRLAQQLLQAPAPKPWSDQLKEALQAFDATQLAQSTEAAILWRSVRTQISTVGPNWHAELLDRLQRAAEARVAEKPRDKELGSVAPAVIEMPSLTVAMPETDAPKTAATSKLKHAWPVRSIVKRPAVGHAEASEPRTAALPQSTIEIHTR